MDSSSGIWWRWVLGFSLQGLGSSSGVWGFGVWSSVSSGVVRRIAKLTMPHIPSQQGLDIGVQCVQE